MNFLKLNSLDTIYVGMAFPKKIVYLEGRADIQGLRIHSSVKRKTICDIKKCNEYIVKERKGKLTRCIVLLCCRI